ncbi:MAG TPA: hypothetical protein VK203_27570 [Nostocaceae cyanobacterium]|nr:hypothetical protein [Nostocaceae cyanobacterium]
MASTIRKKLIPWTEAHAEFCLEFGIPPASQNLWRWLLQFGIGEAEPDLSEFNAWVAKHRGKPYAHNYLKFIFQVLVDNQVIQVIKQFSWKIYRCVIRPIDWVKPPKKKNLRNHNQSYSLGSENDREINDQEYSSSNSNNPNLNNKESERKIILRMCAQMGIVFDDFNPLTEKLLNFSSEQVRTVLRYFFESGGLRDLIPNPQEFLINSLDNFDKVTKQWEFEEKMRQHEILKLCLEAGIYFDPKKSTTQELFDHEIEDIKKALNYFVKRGGTDKNRRGESIIKNPQGWLLECLRNEYWSEYEISLDEALLAIASHLPSIPRDY